MTSMIPPGTRPRPPAAPNQQESQGLLVLRGIIDPLLICRLDEADFKAYQKAVVYIDKINGLWGVSEDS